MKKKLNNWEPQIIRAVGPIPKNGNDLKYGKLHFSEGQGHVEKWFNNISLFGSCFSSDC